MQFASLITNKTDSMNKSKEVRLPFGVARRHKCWDSMGVASIEALEAAAFCFFFTNDVTTPVLGWNNWHSIVKLHHLIRWL